MTDRLTIAAARPGMRVRFLSDQTRFAAGDEAIIARVDDGYIYMTGLDYVGYRPRIFAAVADTLAALLAERAPEFLAAVRECHRVHNDCMRWSLCEPLRSLLAAIERAGLIAQEPRTTFHLTPQQFQEMWNVG